MSEALGPQKFSPAAGEVFLGRDFSHQPNHSEEVASAIDREVRSLVDEAHSRAASVLAVHRDTLERMARQLVERETLDALELGGILGSLDPWPVAGDPVRPAHPGLGQTPLDAGVSGARAPADAVDGAAGSQTRTNGSRRRRSVAAPNPDTPAGVASRDAGPAGGITAPVASTAPTPTAAPIGAPAPTATPDGATARAAERVTGTVPAAGVRKRSRSPSSPEPLEP